ncbi:MAG TPA: CAP domain-containing protein [Allocoleopsis sp.]
MSCQLPQSAKRCKPRSLLGDSAKRSRLLWIVCTSAALALVGCEPVTDFFPKLPQPGTPPKTLPTSQASVQSPATAKMEAAVRQRINEIREQKGLNALENNEKLAQVARNYSQQMARDNFFSHTGSDGSTLATRVRAGRIFYWVVGENLFKSRNIAEPVPVAVQGWMKSPGHRENILRPIFTQTGVGVWKTGSTYYITQLFMRSPF